MTKLYGVKKQGFEDGVCICGSSFWSGKHGTRTKCPTCSELDRKEKRLRFKVNQEFRFGIIV